MDGSSKSINSVIIMLYSQSASSITSSVLMANDCKFFLIYRWISLMLAFTLDFIYLLSDSLFPMIISFIGLFFQSSVESSIFLSLSFSSLSCLISLSTSLSLTTGLFLIFLVLSAYLKVDKVSSQLSFAGEMAHIIVVLELPPNAFYRILVRADYL